MIERFEFAATPESPGIRFLYIDGIHSSASWREPLDLRYCKINVFLQGHSYIIINGKSHEANSGDILIYHPHDVHYGNVPYEQRIEYYEFLFEPEAVECLCGGAELVSLFAGRDEDIVLLQPDAERFRRLSGLLDRLLRCMRGEGPHRNTEALGLFLSILLRIDGCRDTAAQLRAAAYYPEPLIRAMDYINQHYQDALSNEEAARRASVSPSYLCRLFRTYLNCTPHQYLVYRRLSVACSCLSRGMSVTETCFAAGFSDCSAFAALFKRHYRVSPSRYRKNGQMYEGDESVSVLVEQTDVQP